MGVLLGFGDTELMRARVGHDFTQRLHQIFLGKRHRHVQRAVVGSHGHKACQRRDTAAIEPVKIREMEGAHQLAPTVGAKIDEEDTVAVPDAHVGGVAKDLRLEEFVGLPGGIQASTAATGSEARRPSPWTIMSHATFTRSQRLSRSIA